MLVISAFLLNLSFVLVLVGCRLVFKNDLIQEEHDHESNQEQQKGHWKTVAFTVDFFFAFMTFFLFMPCSSIICICFR